MGKSKDLSSTDPTKSEAMKVETVSSSIVIENYLQGVNIKRCVEKFVCKITLPEALMLPAHAHQDRQHRTRPDCPPPQASRYLKHGSIRRGTHPHKELAYLNIQ